VPRAGTLRRARSAFGPERRDPLAPLSWFAFFVFGVVLVLPGASQPALARDLGLGLAASGGLASFLSLGLGLGVIGAGPLVDRVPRRPFFCAAAILAAVALIGLPGWDGAAAGAAFLAMAAVGFGAGGFETVLNTVVPERDPARAAARLAVAHSAATAGAAIGAAVVAGGIALLGWRGAWAGLGFALVGVAAAGALVRMPKPVPPEAPASARAGLLPAVVPFAVASAAYVGMESSLTVFLPAFVRAGGGSAAQGALAISAFWAGLFFSRLGFAAWRPARERRVLAVGTLLGAALLLSAPAMGGVAVVWAAGVGILLGPVFPLLVARGGARFAHARGTATGWVVGAGSLGGVLVPWFAGLGAERVGVSWAIAGVGLATLGILAAARR